MSDDIILRKAIAADIETMRAFIFEHGPNPWNHLPEKDVTDHLRKIASGEVGAVLAEQGDRLAGFVTYCASDHLKRYQPAGADAVHGYIGEAVVHRDFKGKGLGSKLLDRAVAALAERGFREIYIERHEENAGSAGMMKKAGFEEVDCFEDLARRPSGSHRTTVCRILRPKRT